MRSKALCLVGCAAIVGMTAVTALAEEPEVIAKSITKAPTLDGKADDWDGVSSTSIDVTAADENDEKNYTGDIAVSLKAAVNGDKIYFLAQWPDSTHDATHKTLHWNAEKDGYEEGKDSEDRLALNFPMSGDFNFCMLNGTEFKADVWHWKAYRSQQAGIFHDKTHVMSFTQLPKAKKHVAHNGKEIWILRPSDQGDKLYKSQRLIDKKGETEPRYLVNKNVSGSIADVRSEAVWADGKWTVEFTRKLNTGYDDDIVFEHGKSYSAGLAVFNHTGDNHHSDGPFVLKIE